MLIGRLATVAALVLAPTTLVSQEAVAVESAPEPLVVLDIETLEEEIGAILEENEVPGASIAVVDRNQTLWAGGVGKADVAADVDVTADHLFRVGSISKSFNALAVLSAVEDGQVDLEAPVRDLVPDVEFTNRWADSHPVTVAMVLEHTSGFDDIHFREYAKVDATEMTLAAGLAYNPNSRRSRWRPGTHMSYCNSGPPIAAYVTQQATGVGFEEYIQAEVFGPIGMATATFRRPAEPGLLAKGYEGDGTTEAHYDHIIIRPSGAMNASATDMARYLRMMINRGTIDGVEVVRPETIERMETPTTTLAARAGEDFGYGLGNYASIVNGHRFQGHNGGITGFVSTSAYSSELGVGYFVSVNGQSGAALRGIAELLGKALTPAGEAPQAEAVELSASELAAITGYYQNVTPRQQIGYAIERFFNVRRTRLVDGELTLGDVFGEGDRLVPVTSSRFRLEDEPEATIFRLTDEEGSTFLQHGLGGNRRQISGLALFSQYALAVLVVLLMLSAFLFALVWVPLKPFGKLRRVPLLVVLPPLLAVASFLGAFYLPLEFADDTIQALGNRTPASLTLFLGSFPFVGLTMWSLYAAYRAYRQDVSRVARLHSTLVSLACAVVALYLGVHGLIGLRTWAF